VNIWRILNVSCLGTIESTANKSSVTNGNLFLDMAAEFVEERRVGAEQRRAKRASLRVTRATSTGFRAEDTVSNPSPETSPIKTPSVSSHSVVGEKAVSLHTLLESQTVRLFVGTTVSLLVLLVFLVLALFSRLSAVENLASRGAVDEVMASKVAFLEFIVAQLHRNVTGTAKFDEQLELWLKSSILKEQISSMQSSLSKMMSALDSQEMTRLREVISVSADTLRTIESRALFMSGQSSWLWSIFYWLFIICIILGVSYLIKLFADGKFRVA